jgi:hypothetical protein
MGRVMLIDSLIKDKLRQLKETAESTPFTLQQMIDFEERGENVTKEEVMKYRVLVPHNVVVTFLIETQLSNNDTPILVRHLSMFLLDMKTPPHPAMVEHIMEELGFKTPLKECFVFFKENDKIVNVIEHYNP